MARELVLIPRLKYDHMLKQIGDMDGSQQIEDIKGNQQIGGQIDNRETKSDINSKIEEQVQTQRSGETLPTDDQNALPSEKPTLFVEKPLSKMKFGRQISTQLVKRAPKRPWTNYVIKNKKGKIRLIHFITYM